MPSDPFWKDPDEDEPDEGDELDDPDVPPSHFFRDDRGGLVRRRPMPVYRYVAGPQAASPSPTGPYFNMSEEHHESATGMPLKALMKELALRMLQYALAGAFQAAAQFFSTRRRFK